MHPQLSFVQKRFVNLPLPLYDLTNDFTSDSDGLMYFLVYIS